MLPMLIALLGSGLNFPEKLFLGWFGPRGLASVVFIIIVVNEQLPGESTLIITVVCTVTLSVLAHGLSANPLAKALAAYERRHPKPAGDSEANHQAEMPVIPDLKILQGHVMHHR